MDNFTFEYQTHTVPYETYEWDSTWIDHPNDTVTKRVLYIGDSISCATRRVATSQAEGRLLFDGFGTSKGIDNPYFRDSIRLFAAQQPGRAAVIFNNGLHGWHLSVEEYAAHYERFLDFLRKAFPDTPVFLALTTSIAGEKNDRVIAENKAVEALAEKYKLPVIDLYAASRSREGLISKDKIHLVPEGYELLAKEILNTLAENGIKG